MRKNNFVFQIPILDIYLISEITRPLFFSIVIVTIVAESIGISFEQLKFLIQDNLPFDTFIYIHIFKLPEFFVLALPISCIMATIFTYQKLSNNSEIIAIRSCGLSLYRLIFPSIIVGLCLTVLFLIVNQVIVPYANYNAALLLETSLGYNRQDFKKVDAFYREFSTGSFPLESASQGNYLKYLLYMREIKDSEIEKPILLIRDKNKLNAIISSNTARCDQDQGYCYFDNGTRTLIGQDGSYNSSTKFERLYLYLPNLYSQIHIDKEGFQDRELNFFQAYHKLSIFRLSMDQKNFLKLQVYVYKNFTLATSCTIFAFLGASIGINLQPRMKYNSFSLTLAIILTYDAIQMIVNISIVAGNIPIHWMWLPNIIGICIGNYILIRKDFFY
jgi:lipopolysaccharide export system permease protein